MSSQPPKDFLALSHGHEWVNFYESFDKLVQDHLSRSSELLRKAMSLPEVADREVAQVRTDLEGQLSQVRTDLEGQLATERQQHQAALNSLRAEIGSSHQQAASLARMFGSLLTDLDRLSITVESAISAQPETVATPVADTSAYGQAEIAGTTASTEPSTDEPVTESSTETPAWSTEAVAESSETVTEANADEAVSGESQAEIDLNALAAAESETTDAPTDVEAYLNTAEEAETTEATDDSEADSAPKAENERPRPHWLSVARSNSSH